MLPSGEIITFEPSVLVPHTSMSNRKKLAIFAKYADVDGGIMVCFQFIFHFFLKKLINHSFFFFFVYFFQKTATTYSKW